VNRGKIARDIKIIMGASAPVLDWNTPISTPNYQKVNEVDWNSSPFFGCVGQALAIFYYFAKKIQRAIFSLFVFVFY